MDRTLLVFLNFHHPALQGPISEGLHKHKSPKGGTGSSADPPSPEQPEGPPLPLKAAKKDREVEPAT